MSGRVFFSVVLVLIGAAWGVTIPMTKVAVSTGYLQFGLIFWELALSSVVLFLITLVQRSQIRLRLRHIWLLLIIALSGTIIPSSFTYIAAPHLPAGILAIVVSLVPMFTLPIALVVRLEQFEPVRMLGLLFGGAAIILLIGPEASLPEAGSAVFVLFAVLSAICYGIEGNYVAYFGLGGLGAVQALLFASLGGLVLITPVAIYSGQWIDLNRDWGAPEWSILGLSVCHAFAYSGYVWLVGRAGAVFSAQVAYLVTLFGVLWSIVFLKETYSGWVWAALALMMVGLFLVQPRPKAEAA
ncbi:MAG: DMT family transporter [Rhodobacteraceae bacterium]|nr:DMT family transporter [Paracoccaceae bacterium]